MGMTLTEKIIANAAGRDSVKAGENVWVDVNVLMTHDVCGPGTIGIFKDKFGADAKVFDKENVVIIPDHYIFTEDKRALRNIDILTDFAKEQDIPNYYQPGTDNYMGVCHVTLPEKGHVRPGEIILGTDSHTCTHGALGAFATGIGNTDAAFTMGTGRTWLKVPETIKFVLNGKLPKTMMAKDLILHMIGEIGFSGATYCAMEFEGPVIDELSIEERMTICNMAIEAGGKNGVIAADAKVEAYVKERTDVPYTLFKADADADYKDVYEINCSELEPTVAIPSAPDKRKGVSEIAGTELTRAYIGSCTGGKTEDFAAAAEIMYGQKVVMDTFVVPSTTFVEKDLNTLKFKDKTYMEIFLEAGCRIGPPGCAACLGGPEDTFGRTHAEEIVVSTTNRNFPGRMGSMQAKVYLASPYVAAASALTGVITQPDEYLESK